MFLSMTNMMFILTLSTGTILSISAPSWFGAWIGLELNLLSFIPLITKNKNQYSSEAALKYFLIQALGSALIIFSASTMLLMKDLSTIMMTAPLLLKLGAAPFHFWFPQIMEGLSWPQAIILMTIQKIAPIFLLSYLIKLDTVFYIILTSGVLSAVIGSLMGLNQTSLRKILAFSSINHMAWLLMSLTISEKVMILYFIFYCLISSSVALLFYLHQTYYFSHLINQNNLPNNFKALTSMSLLSLGGLPPFTGFFPKWIVVQEMSTSLLFMPLIILLLSALITLYFYLRISVSFFTLSSPKIKFLAHFSPFELYITPMFIFINSVGIISPSLMLM
uniref:NADH-ubiquinone oxidoreductase chain 2 n=1 Tax=Stemonopa insignis TaxID=2020973 RepID=A0A3Q8B0M3_9EUCA|nr:NADH dehydrogenase subunit 2 [Stemonopa insignis]